MFVNFQGIELAATDGDSTAAMAAGQALVLQVQEEVHHMEGQVNKMLVDDKGTVMLCVFGLPPRPHADDPLRAVRAALAISKLMSGRDSADAAPIE